MNILVKHTNDIDDNLMEQLMYMEADACAYYASLNEDDDSGKIIIGAIPSTTVKQFRKKVANTLFLMRIRKKAGKEHLIGMACISNRGRGNEKYLHTVYVKPLHRDKGIGRALVQKATLIAKKNKYHLFLGVNPLNKIAIHLYESLGFKACKDQSVTMDFYHKKIKAAK